MHLLWINIFVTDYFVLNEFLLKLPKTQNVVSLGEGNLDIIYSKLELHYIVPVNPYTSITGRPLISVDVSAIVLVFWYM